MKENKRLVLVITLSLLLVSGCGLKPAPPAAIPAENTVATPASAAKEESAAEVPKPEAAKTPVLAESNEQSYSRHSGELMAKNGHILIYAGEFSNIYMVDTETKVNRLLVKCSRPEKLYFDGTYVYYLPYYQIEKGIYRASLTGEVEKICPNSSLQLWLTDDKIYFTDQSGYDRINGTPQGNLCSMNKDGSNIQVLIQNVKNYFYIQDQHIYYTDLNSRSLYRAELDGSGRQMLAQGRTYINAAGDNYVIYADFADSEAFHLVNVRTGENTVLGQFGLSRRYDGETYVQTREKGADGIPSLAGWSVLQVNKETGKTEPRALLNIANVGIDMMQYVHNGWVYLYSTSAGQGHQKGAYRVNLSPDPKTEYIIDRYLYYLDGYGYYLDQDDAGQPTGLGRINLKTGEITTWPLEQQSK